MIRDDVRSRAATGAISGLAATAGVAALPAAAERWLPSATAPIRKDPGESMVEKAEAVLPDVVSHIPEPVEKGGRAPWLSGTG